MADNTITRRTFMQSTGLVAASLLTDFPSLNQPFRRADDTSAITKPAPEWIKTLYERGGPTTYRKTKDELHYIGMPVGGIGCGCVYLGGDGRLWLWDIFNKNQTGVIYRDIPWHEKIQNNKAILRPFDGANYVEPVKDVRPVEQGFALKIDFEGKSVTKRLLPDDWDDIEFEATYPMATIRYLDATLPVQISLQVYSPFIPLDADNSGLPATIYSFTVTNRSQAEVMVSVVGWLENKAALYTATDDQYTKSNKAVPNGVFSTALNKNWADDAYYFKPDYGNFCLLSLNPSTVINTSATLTNDALFSTENSQPATKRFDEPLLGSVRNTAQIAAGKTAELHYVLSWYFPNLSFHSIKNETKRYYANRFKSAAEVATYIQQNFAKLSGETKAWCQTWYTKSTLPHWFLERTLLNVSTLATTTSHRFSSGRFYAWEGVGSCAGTCTHVWQYAQAMGRLFPALERDTRERVDLGVGFHDDGHIGFRAEYDQQPAIDGQAGRVLGIYREHQMSANDEFLRRNWPKTKRAIEYILEQDRNGNGMVDSQLENTLDAKWPGEIAWLVGLCLAAVKAGERMAEEMADSEFAAVCKAFFDKGKANMESQLFNGEYFIHKPDPKLGKTVLGSYDTCHIDQVYGQSWAFQVGLGRIIDQPKTLSALRSLWKYNFTTDVGPYLKTHHGGRPYALPGEGGMLMNTNPSQVPLPYGVEDAWQVTYFHECMSGFEHQVAGHMLAEGMTDEGLALIRTVHDRYHAAKRNPFNEVECSDHYARAMASYGAFITACGYAYHGPKGEMAFAPKWSADKFMAPFTAAEGWGTYSQQKQGKTYEYRLDVAYGSLALAQLTVEKGDKKPVKKIAATLGGQPIAVQLKQTGNTLTLKLPSRQKIQINQPLVVMIQG
ncbi:GH116 family glycosyl-hydrolase [Spirosoma panaciterrae]|uniref:GH116 family glycosyl-hydrolase n=1 Tax=Spirosoma panaciterrae TaxID=496058 RepID=UPI000367659F|nr:GH116 family glycosyl-hydrolase [Spirosoma panaciterrae]